MRRGVVGGLSRAGVADAVLAPSVIGASASVFNRASTMLWNAVRSPAYEFPLTLFQRNEPGVWYDPSDLTTMFQDAAGTVPVTAVEQPVRLWLDKSGRGNHATASADARRPVLSARVNLLDATTTLATQSVTVVAASHTLSFTGTGTITLSGASTAGPLVGTGATDRVSLTFTPTAGSLTLTVSGTVTDADLRVTNDGVGIPPYQRVTTSTDYDTAGFPLYLRFDGTDDCLFTGNVDFSATDKVTACAGVRKLSDAAAAIVCELSALASNNNGTFFVAAPGSVGANVGVLSRGTATASQVNAGFVAPITRVVGLIGDIAGPVTALRVNASEIGRNTNTQGTGNYGTYSLFIGARNNASVHLNGRIYQLVVRGALTDTPVLEQLEGFVNAKTQAY